MVAPLPYYLHFTPPDREHGVRLGTYLRANGIELSLPRAGRTHRRSTRGRAFAADLSSGHAVGVGYGVPRPPGYAR
jgi:hypothetical protein